MTKIIKHTNNRLYVSTNGNMSQFAEIGCTSVQNFDNTQVANYYVMIEHMTDGSTLQLFFRDWIRSAKPYGEWVVKHIKRGRVWENCYPSFSLALGSYVKKANRKYIQSIGLDYFNRYNVALTIRGIESLHVIQIYRNNK